MQSQSPFNPLTPHFTVLDIWKGFGIKYSGQIVRILPASTCPLTCRQPTTATRSRVGSS